MNAPSGNDTRPSANDTRSVFTAINPLKRRVSFRDMPNIHEYEHASSTSTPTPSPLPSGFLDKTRTIFTSLEPAQQHNNQQQQQMPQQQQLQNVFKFDDADDSSLSLTKSLRLPSTPSHSSADAEGMDMEEINAMTVAQTPTKLLMGMDMEEINAMTVAQTPTKLLMIDKVDKYGAINEQMNHTHVIQHTPFHNRLLSLTSTNTEMVMLNELTKRHGGSSLLFGSQEGYGLDNMSTVDQTMNIDEEQKQIFLASKTEEVGDNLDDLFAVKQSMSMDAQQQHEQQPEEGQDGLDELSVAAQSMSIICSDVQQQQTNKSAAGAAADGRASSLSAAAVTLLTETPKSSHQTTRDHFHWLREMFDDDNPFTLVTFVGRIGLGLLYVKVLQSLFNIFYPYLVGRPRNLRELAGENAGWAVVTGATDGIGKAYARELAQRGFDLVLISRSADKLETVATELKQYSRESSGLREVQVRTVQFDFTNAKLADYEQHIFVQINDINVGILVNNVGMSNANDYPERIKFCMHFPIVNTLPVTVLSAFVLRQMVKRGGRGVVVNVSSASAYIKWYQYAVYSATKKYIAHLSDILRKEFAADHPNIVIQTVCPMLVATKLTQRTSRDGLSLLSAGPGEFAQQAIRTIGLVAETSGCLIHQIQVELLFNFLLTFIPTPVFDFFQAIRTIGLVAETSGCLIHQIQVELLFNFLLMFIPTPVFDFFVRLEAHLHKSVLNTASKHQ
uniref:Hydroxysteroid dehydrogenase-like protein 2 n=1 Tax=Globodera pallida TaxID=36090 RepID=A0A183C0T3_GLOPA